MKPRPCPDCDDTGKTCGAPDCGTGCKCPTCWCDDCGFAPCECIQPQEVCAWCSKVIKTGSLPASHGICKPCGVKFQAEADALKNPK